MKKIFTLVFAALFAASATAQKDTIFVLIKAKQPPIVFSPRLKEAYFGEVKETPVKVLGVFKSKEKASLWLGVGGALAMVYGSWEHGKAAYIIQTQGHTHNWDKYERTRFRGFLGHGLGIAAETTSFVYRQEKWYRKWAIPLGVLEAGLWFWVNKEVAEFTYRQMSK